jgi:hypothetical protein
LSVGVQAVDQAVKHFSELNDLVIESLVLALFDLAQTPGYFELGI